MDSSEVIDDANCSAIFLSKAPITVGVLQLHTVAVSICSNYLLGHVWGFAGSGDQSNRKFGSVSSLAT